jgi:hypothetical protein
MNLHVRYMLMLQLGALCNDAKFSQAPGCHSDLTTNLTTCTAYMLVWLAFHCLLLDVVVTSITTIRNVGHKVATTHPAVHPALQLEACVGMPSNQTVHQPRVKGQDN